MSAYPSLKGKVVVITGASSGLGRALARALGEQGARLGLIARGEDGLLATSRELSHLGAANLVLPLDVSDHTAVEAAARMTAEHFGRIDVWINNAMLSVFAPITDVQPDEFERVMKVNYLGTVYGTQSALRQMLPRNQGLIVQIGSALAYRSIPLQSAYCASKAAIRGFTDSLRSELLHLQSEVKVTMLQLPAINTPQFEVVRNKLGGHPKPVPPIYQPELCADAVLDAIVHPSRERWIGGTTIKAILAQHLLPSVADWYLAKTGWEQSTRELPPPRGDNLDVPLRGDRGSRGAFDLESKEHSAQIFARKHRGLLALAGLTVAIAAGAGFVSARKK